MKPFEYLGDVRIGTWIYRNSGFHDCVIKIPGATQFLHVHKLSYGFCKYTYLPRRQQLFFRGKRNITSLKRLILDLRSFNVTKVCFRIFENSKILFYTTQIIANDTNISTRVYKNRIDNPRARVQRWKLFRKRKQT